MVSSETKLFMYAIFASSILLFAFYFIFVKERKESNNKVSFETYLEGEVAFTTQYYNSVRIRLKEDSIMYWIPMSSNNFYNPSYLDDFLSVGDRIYKPINSDTLYVEKNNNNYFFVVGQYLD